MSLYITDDNGELHKLAGAGGSSQGETHSNPMIYCKSAPTRFQGTAGSYVVLTHMIQDSAVGNKFTINNGVVTVGSGVKKIAINANVMIWTEAERKLFALRVYKNDTMLDFDYLRPLYAQSNDTMNTGVMVVDVVENDQIYLSFYTEYSGGAIEKARLFIEALE